MSFWYLALIVVLAAVVANLAGMRKDDKRPQVLTSDELDENSIL